MYNIFKPLLLLATFSVCVPLAAQEGPPAARTRPVTGPPARQLTDTELITPNDTVLMAYNDLQTIPTVDRKYIRYLSNFNFPTAYRPKVVESANFVVNSLSRARLLRQIAVVPGSASTVMRIDVRNYQKHLNGVTSGWSNEAWNDLAALDYTFTAEYIKADLTVAEQRTDVQEYGLQITKVIPNGVAATTSLKAGDVIMSVAGKRTQTFEELANAISSATGAIELALSDGSKVSLTPVNKKIGVSTEPISVLIRGQSVGIPVASSEKRFRQYATEWIDTKILAEMAADTGVYLPILRADWFIANATLPPHYYKFLGIGDKVDDFLAIGFATEAELQKARLALKGIVVKSGVSNVIAVSENSRAISREQTRLGYLWRTRDVEKVNDKNSYLRTLDDSVFDASEWIMTLENGLQGYLLSNKDGKRQDEAPIQIVRDNTNADRRVRCGRSCITCHARGINEFKPMPQEMVKYLINIISPDPLKNKELRETYISNLEEYIGADQEVYRRAVFLSNGLDMETNASQYGTIYKNYFDELVQVESAAFELALPVKDLKVALFQAKNDPFLLNLSRGVKFLGVPRAEFERSYQQAMVLATKMRGRR